MTKKQYQNYAEDSGLLRAIKHAGGQAQLAKLIGVSQNTISTWLKVDALRRRDVHPDTAMLRAIKLAGGQVKLANLLGVKQQAVNLWAKQGFAPLDRVRDIEMHTGIARAELVDPSLRSAFDSGVAL